MKRMNIMIGLIVVVAMVMGATIPALGVGPEEVEHCICGPKKVLMCHAPGTDQEKTVCVNINAVDELILRADFILGACEDPCRCCVGIGDICNAIWDGYYEPDDECEFHCCCDCNHFACTATNPSPCDETVVPFQPDGCIPSYCWDYCCLQ